MQARLLQENWRSIRNVTGGAPRPAINLQWTCGKRPDHTENRTKSGAEEAQLPVTDALGYFQDWWSCLAEKLLLSVPSEYESRIGKV